MTVFYPLPRCLFYRVGGFHWDRFTIILMRPLGRSEVEKIVHWMPEILFAAQITFGRLDGCMPQQKLNLLKLTPAAVAQIRTRSPQVVRCSMLQACSLAAGLDHVPHDILRDAFPPHLSRPGDGSEYPSLRDPGCSYPMIERCFNPIWNRNGADVAALSDPLRHIQYRRTASLRAIATLAIFRPRRSAR